MNPTPIHILLYLISATRVEMKLNSVCTPRKGPSSPDCNATAFEKCGEHGKCICQDGFKEFPKKANPAINLPINVGCHLPIFYTIPGICAKSPSCPPRSSCKNDRCICDEPGYAPGLWKTDVEENCFIGSYVDDCQLKYSSSLSGDQTYHSFCLPPILVVEGATCMTGKLSDSHYIWDPNRNICYDEDSSVLDTTAYRMFWMKSWIPRPFNKQLYDCGGRPPTIYFCGCRGPGHPSCDDVHGSGCHTMIEGKKNDECYVPPHIVCDMSKRECVCNSKTEWNEKFKECLPFAMVEEPCDLDGDGESRPIKCITIPEVTCAPSSGKGSAGVCSCPVGKEFDPKRKVCRLPRVKFREPCSVDWDCVEDLYCNKGNCDCDSVMGGVLYDPVGMDCVIKNDVPCKKNEGRQCARGSVCTDANLCKCNRDNNGFIWSSEAVECGIDHGKPCDLTDSGSPRAAKCLSSIGLTCTPSDTSMTGGVCSCAKGLEYGIIPGSHGECRVKLNAPCKTDRDCSHRRFCDTTREPPTCQCDLKSGSVYDPKVDKCVTTIGKSCKEHQDCLTGSSCHRAKTHNWFSRDLVCQCDDGLVFDERETECRVDHGGKCDLGGGLLKCATSHGLLCMLSRGKSPYTYSTCSCADGKKFDLKARECRIGAHKPCDVNEECANELVCDTTKTNPICDCESNRYGLIYDHYKATCVIPTGKPCFYGMHDCVTGAKCNHQNFRCECDLHHKFVWDKNENECRVDHGGKCDLGTNDNHGSLQCVTTLGLICKSSYPHNTCSCVDGMKFDRAARECRAGVNKPCKDNRDCAEELVCNTKKSKPICECDYQTGAIYDLTKDTCAMQIGKPCKFYGELGCVTGAICNWQSQLCECDSDQNLAWDKIKNECRMDFGGNCDTSTNSNFAKCRSYRGSICKPSGKKGTESICTCVEGMEYSFAAKECKNKVKQHCNSHDECASGLICNAHPKPSTCECNTKMDLMYDAHLATCVLPVNGVCTDEWQVCTHGASCTSSGARESCKCEDGFQHDRTNPKQCMPAEIRVNQPCIIGGLKKCPPRTECRAVDRKNGPTSCFPIVNLPQRKNAGCTTPQMTSNELFALVFSINVISQFHPEFY